MSHKSKINYVIYTLWVTKESYWMKGNDVKNMTIKAVYISRENEIYTTTSECSLLIRVVFEFKAETFTAVFFQFVLVFFRKIEIPD